jgi:hypothetical protein
VCLDRDVDRHLERELPAESSQHQRFSAFCLLGHLKLANYVLECVFADFRLYP